MIDPTLARTALGGPSAPTGRAIGLAEAPLMGMATVRGDLASPELAEAVRAAVGVDMPAPRKFVANAEAPARRALWMSPDELMLQAAAEDNEAVLSAAKAALSGVPHLVLDVSAARSVFTLTGDGAREVLAKGAPVDLHPSAFGVGDLRRTRLGQVAVAIYQTAAGPDVFELFCFRSYAPYVWDWLIASSKTGSLPDVLTTPGA